MECKNENVNSTSASILTLGIGWFPNNPGGLERYIYELTHILAANQYQIELCGVGLPDITAVTNLAKILAMTQQIILMGSAFILLQLFYNS